MKGHCNSWNKYYFRCF